MKNKIYVGNLSYNTGEDALRDLFNQYGNIDDIKVIKDFETGRSKGFGFITYSTPEEADSALSANGQEIDGRKLRVNIAQDNNRSGGGGARRGGGGGARHHNR